MIGQKSNQRPNEDMFGNLNSLQKRQKLEKKEENKEEKKEEKKEKVKAKKIE